MEIRWRFCFYAVVLGLLACTAPTTTPPTKKGPEYPQDSLLKLNQFQGKGTHNSYHIASDMNVKAWAYTHAPLTEQLEVQGVRQFELDVYWNHDREAFDVYHVPGLDAKSRCPVFTDCLKEIKAWSDKNLGHMPLFIFIEPKLPKIPEGPEDHFKKIEKEILSVFERKALFTPDDLRKERSSLQEAIEKDGWPAFKDVRQKVIFVLLVGSPEREEYTKEDPAQKGKLCFVTTTPDKPYAAILKIDDPVAQEKEIQDAVKKGIIIRTRADSPEDERDPARLQAALRSGAHIISTDVPVPQTGLSYVVEIPEGKPARCNPLVAPASCTPKDIESLLPPPSR